MSGQQLYDEYFESVFKQANTFSSDEYAAASRQFAAIYRTVLPADKTAPILDLGCGAGHFLFFLRQAGYGGASGIDISPQQVEFCQRQVHLENVQQADAFSYLKERENTFTVIAMHDILEHIPRSQTIDLVQRVKSALRQDGMFVIRTPNMGNPFSLRLRYTDFTHETGYTDTSLYQMLWVAGFRHIEIQPGPLLGWGNRLLAHGIQSVVRKLMWYQGYVAPRILTPVLIARARN